jgi:hypothetical protein
MTQRPFEIMRWESASLPSLESLTRMLTREGLLPEQVELAAKMHTPEMKFDKTAVRVLVSGKLQFSFPGYGVIELEPGDILEINPGVLHDIIVSSSQPAIALEAFRH